jgi:hypothetical protein
MSSLAISGIVFACVFGGALLGMLLRAALPQHHLSGESKDVVKLGMGLVGTMAALVLGLLVASAKGSFDAQSTELTELAAHVVLLDRLLAHYGSESAPSRDLLRGAVAHMLETTWSGSFGDPGAGGAQLARQEALFDAIQKLSPKDDTQRSIHALALRTVVDMGRTRWLMYEQRTASFSPALLIIVVFWLALILASFGLYAPTNATVVASLAVSALAVSGAVFLILEMYEPYGGLIAVSSAPLRTALAHLGQ